MADRGWFILFVRRSILSLGVLAVSPCHLARLCAGGQYLPFLCRAVLRAAVVGWQVWGMMHLTFRCERSGDENSHFRFGCACG